MKAAVRTTAHVLAVMAIAGADYLIGPVLELRPLYILPVLTAALWVGRRPAVWIGVLAALAVLLVDDLDPSQERIVPLVLFFGGVRVATFVVVASLVSELREQRARLRREAISRDDYVAIVAHELRNPLTGIKAAAGQLRRYVDDPERAAKTAAAIGEEASAGLALIDDLTEVSRAEAGAISYALVPMDLAVMVERTVASFDRGDREVALGGMRDGLRVLGDEARLAQILRNLLSNAAKYSPPGSTIDVTSGLSPRGSSAVVTVRDHGVGISPPERGQLFRKFVRLASAGGTRGSGLGLYISRRIARDHGGDVTADWPSGGGSAFSLTLPLMKDR